MKDFSLLIKPASFDCNLRCKYCFYLRKEEFFGDCKHRMSDEVLEKLVSSFINLDMRNHIFSWQGGEPTMMGLDFYKKALDLMQKYGKGKNVTNTLQTNGTLLTEKWAKVLHDYSFLVGLSLDGSAEIHNENRFDTAGKGTHYRVINTIKLLERNKVEFNILTLVNRLNVERPLEVYRYLKKLGIKYHQYIECVEYMPDGKLAPYAINGVSWGKFLCRIFDEWYKNDRYDISVRLFDTILTKLVDHRAIACSMGRDCRQYLVVEHNGDVYPCDFFVEPRFKLGNIMDNSWEEMLESPLYEQFGMRKRASDEHCSTCQWLDLCAGCCPKNRPDFGEKAKAVSELCAGWKIFYAHTIDRFKSLADEIRRNREYEYRAHMHQQIMGMLQQGKISVEAPCPCGSGKILRECFEDEANRFKR
jgi:uncharacterized protein